METPATYNIDPAHQCPYCTLPLSSAEHLQKHVATFHERLDVDNVNRPAHYRAGDIECIDAIRAALTPEEFRGYLKGNVIKYTWRERLKGGIESMQKARWYINKLLEVFGDSR